MGGEGSDKSKQSELRPGVSMNTNKHYSDAMEVLNSATHLPQFVIIVDYNLGDCRSNSQLEELYPQVKPLINALVNKEVRVIAAVATASAGNGDLLRAIGLSSLPGMAFTGRTMQHNLQELQAHTRVPYECMLFFSPNEQDIQAMSELGLKSVLVRNDINIGVLREGLRVFNNDV